MRTSFIRGRSLACAVLIAAVFVTGQRAFGEEGFDCPAMCEQGTRQALEQCRKNHADDPSQCPADDGRIPEECRRVCAELSGKSPEELGKMLPPNYRDMLEGK